MTETPDEKRNRLAAAGILIDRLLHDLKQPLGLIRIIAQAILLDVKKNRLALDMLPNHMSEIMQSVDTLVLSFDKLRVFARAHPTSSEIKGAQVSTAATLAIERIRHLFPEGDITIEIPPAFPMIPISEEDLAQLFYEIIRNGLCAAHEKEKDQAHVSIRGESSQEKIRIDIQDNGPGFHPDARGPIDAPQFWPPEKNRGMGMSLISSLLHASGGSGAILEGQPSGALIRLEWPSAACH